MSGEGNPPLWKRCLIFSAVYVLSIGLNPGSHIITNMTGGPSCTYFIPFPAKCCETFGLFLEDSPPPKCYVSIFAILLAVLLYFLSLFIYLREFPKETFDLRGILRLLGIPLLILLLSTSFWVLWLLIDDIGRIYIG